jgi:hypothetical protein
MPSSFGQLFGKIMGPLMAVGGAAAAPFTGGATLPIALSGLTQTMGPGGVLGSSATPTMPSIKAPALTSAPIGSTTPDIPTPAGSGLTLAGGGAGAGPGTGAGVQSPDVIQQAVANAMGGQSSDPFAMYQAAA